MFDEIRIVQDETSEYREAVQNAVLFNQTLQELINARNSFSANELERLEALAPASVDEIQLLVDIEALAESHDMLMGNITVDNAQNSVEGQAGGGEATSIEELAYVDISFGLIGTYEQFRAMLGDMEQSLFRLEVMSIDFAVGNSDLQQYEVTVRSYALPSQ
jgi:hypothetical protein